MAYQKRLDTCDKWGINSSWVLLSLSNYDFRSLNLIELYEILDNQFLEFMGH